MATEFQLFKIKTTDRAGVITAVAASLASRGVNIECFAATGACDDLGERFGKFLIIIEADGAYAMVLRKVLKCLEVVLEVSEPYGLDTGELQKWRKRFDSL